MANTLWYEVGYYDQNTIDAKIASGARSYIKEFINLYAYNSFQETEDINVDHLQQFLEIIFKNYQYYNISFTCMEHLGDAFEEYFTRLYCDNDSGWWYPKYSKNDKRYLPLCILDHCMASYIWGMFLPEEVPFLIECMNASSDQLIHMEEKLENYFKQFDRRQRNIELSLRFRVINKERLEALQKSEPLPIRPMGIELDMCYKSPKPSE